MGENDDITFGGWVNFNNFPEQFSCIKSSHVLEASETKKPGFNKFSQEDQVNLKQKFELVNIKPGQAIIFVDNIIHEVFAEVKKVNRYRLFIGFRLTKSIIPMIPNISKMMDDQAIIPLKSGQIPQVFSSHHLSNHYEKLVQFSLGVKDFINVNYTFKSGKKQGKTIRICPRHMPSLKMLSELSGQELMYPPYTQEEIDMHKPMKIV